MLKKSALWVIAVFAIMVACATVGGMKDREGTGISKPFDYPYGKVYDAALEAGKIQNLRLKEGGMNEHYLVYKNSGGWWVGGELIAIFFTEESNSKTVIEIVNQKRSKVDIGTQDWTNGFFQVMDLQLAEKK